MDARENVRIQRAEGINGALLIQDGKKENSPVGERPFNLDLMQEGGDAWKDMPPAQHLLAMLHELCDGVLAIPDALLKLRRDEGHRLGLIELEAAREALLGKGARLCAFPSVNLNRKQQGGGERLRVRGNKRT